MDGVVVIRTEAEFREVSAGYRGRFDCLPEPLEKYGHRYIGSRDGVEYLWPLTSPS